MSVKDKMTAIADAIRSHTLKSGTLSLSDMLTELAELTDYEIPDVEGCTLDERLGIMAEIVRRQSKEWEIWSGNLSLDDMAREIKKFHLGNASATTRIGTRYYVSLAIALANAQDGDTIYLLKDISLFENISITKPITIDGQGHKIIASVNKVDLFTATADFTLQNLNITYTGGKNGKASYSVVTSFFNSSINVIGCNITSDARGITLSGDNSNGYSGTLTVQGSTIVAGNLAIYTWYDNPDITITNSVVLGESSNYDVYWTTVLIEGGCRELNIYSSVISGRSRGLSLWKGFGDVNIKGDSIIGNGWEGLARYGIEADDLYAIEVYGRPYTEYNVTLRDSVMLTSTGKDEVYFREYSADNGTNQLYFDDDYNGPIPCSMLPYGTAGENRYSFHSSLAEAVSAEYENVLLPYNELSLTEPIKIRGTVKIGEIVRKDENSVFNPKIIYVGEGALFQLQENAALTLENVFVTANKILSGFDGTQTVAVKYESVANALISEGYSVKWDSETGYYVVRLPEN